MTTIKEYDIRLDALKTPILIVKKEHHLETVKELSANYDNVNKVADMMFEMFEAESLADEYVWMLCMSSSYKIIGVFEISHGSINGSILPVREIVQKALLKGAVNVIIAHNHPSGDVEPSSVDIGVTHKVSEGLNYVGLKLLDHIILGSTSYGRNYYSFNEHDLLEA